VSTRPAKTTSIICRELKEAIEAICELNHDLLRPERVASKPRAQRDD
jgi:hypothetical protein